MLPDDLLLILVIALLGMAALAVAIAVLDRPQRGVYLVFLTSGFLQFPELPIVGKRLAATEVIVLITWLAVAMHLAHQRERVSFGHLRRVGGMVILPAVFLVPVALSYYFNSVWPARNLEGSTVELLSYAYGWLLFLTVVWLIDDWSKLRRCVLAWVLGAVLVSGISALAAVGLAPDWAFHRGGMRISSTFDRVNQAHSYLAPIAPMVLWWFTRKAAPLWSRIAALAILVMLGVALLTTGSRTALILYVLALVAGLVLLLLPQGWRATHKPLLVSLVVVAVGSVGLLEYAIWFQGPSAITLPGFSAAARPVLRLQESLEQREFLGARGEQFAFVQRHWIEYAALGVGPNNFQRHFAVAHSVHNTYLGVLIENGLPALLILLGWLGLITVSTWRASNRQPDEFNGVVMILLLVGFGLLLSYGVTTYGLRQRPFWLMAGLLVAGVAIARRNNQPAQASRPAMTPNGRPRTVRESALRSRP